MPFPLHKSPSGLLELFRLRTLGANPPLFGEQVSPVVDVTEHYGADVMTSQFDQLNNVTLNGAGGTSVTRTQTALTRLYAMSAQVQMGAAGGTILLLSIGIRAPNASAPVVILADRVVGACPPGRTFRVSIPLPRPLILPNGTVIVSFFESDAIGADHTISQRFLLQDLSSTF